MGPKYLKEDRKFRLDRPSLGGRVQILRQKNRKLCTSSFILRQEPVETKANQCADPIRKKSTNEKKRLKRKIDKWCKHHKISNKNITKGEIPMALKSTQRNGPLKNSKKKRIHKHLKKTNKKIIIKSNFCVQKSKLNSI